VCIDETVSISLGGLKMNKKKL
jgi:hypothetical protein